jgi:hypothetical protein
MDLVHIDREALDTAFREILLFAEPELELPAVNVEAVDTLYVPATDDANHNSNSNNNNNNNRIGVAIDDHDDCVLPDFEDSLLAEMGRLANMDVYLSPPYVWVNFVCVPDLPIHVGPRVDTPRPPTPRLRPVEAAGITQNIPPLDNSTPMPPTPRLEGIDHPDIDNIPFLQLSPPMLDWV